MKPNVLGHKAAQVVDVNESNHTVYIRLPDGSHVGLVYYSNTGVVTGEVDGDHITHTAFADDHLKFTLDTKEQSDD